MKKKSTKPNRNAVLTGALAGIGGYIGIDLTVIRVPYIFLSSAAFGSPITSHILSVLTTPSARSARANYGYNSAYYEKNNYREQTREQAKKRKETEKIDDNEWSDF